MTFAWRIIFPDGTSLAGTTASRLLAAWRRKQWHATDARGWREELAKRAYVWSGTIVDPDLPAGDFLAELEVAGILKIERGN